MSGRSGIRPTDLYSVFVGHIHTNVTRRELGDLFKACGEISDVVILEREAYAYNYGFVRYAEKEAAFRAVREISGWELNGVKLVVDISKDTCAKIKRDNNEPTSTSKGGSCKAGEERQRDRPSNTKLFLQDTMHLNRLKETCSNLQLNGTVKSRIFLEDVGSTTASRFPTVWGSQQDPIVNFHHISQKIMKRCQSSAEVDSSFGIAKKEEFLTSLETIVKEINSVLCTRYEHVAEGDLAEGSMNSGPTDCSDDLVLKHCLDGINVQCQENEQKSNIGYTEALKSDLTNTEELSGKLQGHIDQSDCSSSRCEDQTVKTNETVKSLSLKHLVSGISCGDILRIGTRRNAASLQNSAEKCTDLGQFEDSEQDVSECENTVERNGSSRNIVADDIPYARSDREKLEGATVVEDIPDRDDNVGVQTDDIDNNSDEGSERDTDSEQDISDPAILDYHLSRLQEQRKIEYSEPGEVLNKLFDNISVRSGPGDMMRSVSRDSNMSSESNEGNVDDSGVESDFFSAQGMKNIVFQNEAEFGFGDGRIRGSHHRGPGRRSCPETSSQQSLSQAVIPQKAFDMEESILKSFARGRGVDRQTKAHAVSRGVFALK